MKFLASLFGSFLVSILVVVAPANAGTLTVGITGSGSGVLGANSFSNESIDFYLVGTDNNTNVVTLTTAQVTIGASTVIFSDPMQIGLDSGSDSAFFGYAGGANLLVLTFTPTDFATLSNSNHFNGVTTDVTNSFSSVPTSGGDLSFADISSNLNLTANSVNSTTPLPSTWLMLLSGFVGLGYFAYRGSRKNAALAAA